MHLVENLIWLNCLHLLKDGSIVGSGWEADASAGPKLKPEWELWFIDEVPILIVHGKVRMTDAALIICCSLKLSHDLLSLSIWRHSI